MNKWILLSRHPKISSLQAGTLVGQVALDSDKKIIFQQQCTIAKTNLDFKKN